MARTVTVNVIALVQIFYPFNHRSILAIGPLTKGWVIAGSLAMLARNPYSPTLP